MSFCNSNNVCLLLPLAGQQHKKANNVLGLAVLVAETQLPLKVDVAPDHGRTALKFRRCSSRHLICKYDESESFRHRRRHTTMGQVFQDHHPVGSTTIQDQFPCLG